jgi:phenylpropionate dioxygenase-like ring-hydroxylating dioxygenase large terminal subunit
MNTPTPPVGNEPLLAGRFPLLPRSWLHLCSSQELHPGPVEVELCGKSFVGFRTRGGQVVVLSGRCSHLGARLVNGVVTGDCLACPLHGWEFDSTGHCARIPAAPTDSIPDFARQETYPVAELGGHVFFFTHPQASHPAPFFEGRQPNELHAAQPFDLIADAPWHLVGANGFDMQHFRLAHDRMLIGEVKVTEPSPFARRLTATFEVCGTSWRDRLTRRIAGPQVTMTITDWAGGLILVEAKFARTTSYGMLCTHPLDQRRTRARVIVWIARNSATPNWLAALNAGVRRAFIREFLRSDLPRIAGMRYHPERLIAADQVMADYFQWLQNISATTAQPK